MADKWKHASEGLTAPLEEIRNCTPSDSVDLPDRPRAIAIGTAGTLTITTEDGTDVTIPANCLAVGIWHPMRPVRIKATGTSAAEIIYGW